MRFFGRIEKATLALVAGFVFMFVATTPAPGLQTLVASSACPEGTTRTVVVRYPSAAEPVEMVRNTPLVCILGDEAVLASHARILPALAVMGTAGAAAVIVVLSVLTAILRRARGADDRPRPPPTSMERIRWIWLLISTPFVFLTAYGAYWWMAVDTPYRQTSCRSSSGGSATCYDGESVYRMLTLLFAALAVAGTLVWVISVYRSRRRAARFAVVATEGRRAPATLLSVERTSTEINGARLYRFLYEVQPQDGSPTFRFVEKSTDTRTSVGGTIEVMYDPGDTSNAFAVPGSERAASTASAAPAAAWTSALPPPPP